MLKCPSVSTWRSSRDVGPRRVATSPVSEGRVKRPRPRWTPSCGEDPCLLAVGGCGCSEDLRLGEAVAEESRSDVREMGR